MTLLVSAALCAHAERPPLPGAYRHNAEERQKQSKVQEKTKKKLAQYKTDAVADVKAEVLSCHGEDDDLIPIARVKAYAEALCAKRPKAMRIEVLPKTGHAESEIAAYAKQDAWKWLLR